MQDKNYQHIILIHKFKKDKMKCKKFKIFFTKFQNNKEEGINSIQNKLENT